MVEFFTQTRVTSVHCRMIKNSVLFQSRSCICLLLLNPAPHLWIEHSTTHESMRNLFHFLDYLKVKIYHTCDLFLLGLETFTVNPFLSHRQENGVKASEAGVIHSVAALACAGGTGQGMVIARRHCWRDFFQGLHIWVVLLPRIRHVLWLVAAQI